MFADVVVKDADGKLFKFSGASFYYDLTPLDSDGDSGNTP